MIAQTSTPWAGLSLVFLAGCMCGLFALPMRFLARWSWENVWAVFILVSCVVMPATAAIYTAPDMLRVLHAAPGHAVAAVCIAGFAWGFGAIMFGQGVSAIGVAMSNTLVLAISAALGSFLPMIVLAPERVHQPQGLAIVCGTALGLVGIVCFGAAGFARDRSQASEIEEARGAMVGKARPFGIGLLLCVGAGVLSAVLNIGFSLAQPVITTATKHGNSAFAGSCIVWLLALGSGAIPNLAFCGYLLAKHGSWRKFAVSKSVMLYLGAIVMGLLWGGDILVYGFASSKLGKLGPAIGWPVKLIIGMVAANLAGMLLGEWKSARATEYRWLAAGFVILFLAIVVLGWSSRLA